MAIELVVPKLGESISEAVISKWLKQVGEATAVDEPVVDLETDKVSVALPAPVAGVLVEQRFAAGTTVKVGDVIGTINPEASTAKGPARLPGVKEPPAPPAPAASSAPLPTPQVVPPAPDDYLEAREPATGRPHTLPPSVRRGLREPAPAATSPGAGNGSGARRAEATPPASLTPAPAPALTPTSAPAPSSDDEEVVPMTPLRRRIAERLVQAQHTAAILTTFNEIDMSEVMALRARYQEAFTAKHGIKLGFMSLFAKACAESLKAFPGLNAEVRGTDIIYKKHYDFGVAVGGGRGLVVPVVRAVDRLSFAELERAIAELATRARENTLRLEDLAGGTFTISNGGIYGSMMSTPLLNLPQTGILGMHKIMQRPVAVGDGIALRPMMYVALSYDHRVVDGREAVQFLIGVKERIEAPDRLLLSI